jgi:hypothetical protein
MQANLSMPAMRPPEEVVMIADPVVLTQGKVVLTVPD